uniref:FLZ-type domain-containing protein n=1 Tax=Oryza meridionalis TaxID=40149 RepID=A0A0E0CW97_9ORYZ
MIPRAPSLFHIEDGAVGVAATTKKPMPADSGELVGLRLIIQPSPRQRPPLSVLRRSAVRPSPAATVATSQDEAGAPAGRGFMGLGFLNCCYCCHKKLDADMDVFVYKGEHAFCCAECRSQQMAREERREIEMLVRRRRDAFHRRRASPPAKIGGHARLQIAAS